MKINLMIATLVAALDIMICFFGVNSSAVYIYRIYGENTKRLVSLLTWKRSNLLPVSKLDEP